MADGEQVTQSTGGAGGPAPVPAQAPGGGSPGTPAPDAAALTAGGAPAAAAGAQAPSPAQAPGAATPGQTGPQQVDPWAALGADDKAKLTREAERAKGMQPALQQYQERDKKLIEAFGRDWYDTFMAAPQQRAAGGQAAPVTVQQAVAHVEAGGAVPPESKAMSLQMASTDFNATEVVDGRPVTNTDRELFVRKWEPILLHAGVRSDELPWVSRLSQRQGAPVAPQAPAEHPPTRDQIAEQVMAESRRERRVRSDLDALASPQHLGADWFAQQVDYRGEKMSRRDAVQTECDLQAAWGNPVLPAQVLLALWPRETLARSNDVGEQRGFNKVGSTHVGMPGGAVAPAVLSPEAKQQRIAFLKASGLLGEDTLSEPPPWAAKTQVDYAGGRNMAPQ